MRQLLRDYNRLCRSTLGVYGVGRVPQYAQKSCNNIAKKTKAYNHKQIKLRYNAICILLYFTPCKQHLRWNIIYHFSLKSTTTLVFTMYKRTLLMY